MNNARFDEEAKWVRWVGDLSAITNFLINKSWASPWALLKAINSILRAIGNVSFANNPISGFLILAGMYVGNPLIAGGCLLGGLISVIFSKILNQPEPLLSDGVVVFNGILVSCISIVVFPQLTGIPAEGIFWAILVVFLILGTYIDKGLNAIMTPSKLPALSVPFNVTATLMLLCMRAGVGLSGTQLPIAASPDNATEGNMTEVDWMKVMQGTLLSAGQVYGLSAFDSSIMTYLGFFLFSPLLTVFFYVGAVIGTVSGVFLSTPPYTAVYMGLWGYNSLLASGAMVYFLVPTLSAVLAAVVAALLSAVVQATLQHFFGAMMVPVMSYPFNVATLLLLAISTTENSPFLWVQAKSFPEFHLFRYTSSLRHKQRNAEGLVAEAGMAPQGGK